MCANPLPLPTHCRYYNNCVNKKPTRQNHAPICFTSASSGALLLEGSEKHPPPLQPPPPPPSQSQPQQQQQQQQQQRLQQDQPAAVVPVQQHLLSTLSTPKQPPIFPAATRALRARAALPDLFELLPRDNKFTPALHNPCWMGKHVTLMTHPFLFG